MNAEEHVSEAAAAEGDAAPVKRVLALDAFRGLTVAAMLLVNNPGSWSAVYAPLRHAEWHGWTPTDLIFPFFLFVVGITTHLSMRGERKRGAGDREIVAKVLRRAGLIVLIGLALSAFPFVETGAIAGISDPSLVDRFVQRLATMRIPGVLQRIGVVYLVAGLWELAASRRARPRVASRGEVALVVAILLGYWGAMTLVPVPGSGLRGAELLDEPAATLAAWSDRALFGKEHLYRAAKEWDPEGALSTVPAVATALLGLFAGRWLGSGVSLRRKTAALAAVGAVLALAGLAWGELFPINKNLWTSSYVLFSAGMAAAGLAACVWLIDLRGVRAAAMPWAVFGVNPLLAFAGSGIATRLLTSVVRLEHEGRRLPLQRILYDAGFASWLPPHIASLAWAIAFVTFWFLLLWPLWKRGIVLKV